VDKNAIAQICACIDTYEDEAIKLERELTAIPALSPENDGEGEQQKAEFLKVYLRDELHLETIQEYNAPDNRVSSGKRPNIIATIPGKDTSKTLWIMSHMDVVPPGDLSKWQSDPWTTRVEDGKIYGRGTEDNQQGIVSSLLTAKALLETGIQPCCNVGLMFVADEETGSKYGIQYLLEHRRDLFRPDDLYIIPDSGNADGTIVEVAEKSILWFRFRIEGKQTHGSTPEQGINAFKAGANLIVKLESLYQQFDMSDPVFDPPISTFEPTKKEANVPNVNTIPGDDVFYYDCRILPQYDLDDVKRYVSKLCEEVEAAYHVKVETTIPQEVHAAPPTPVDAPVVKAVVRTLRELRGIEAQPMGIGGGTVAAFFRELGLPTVVWATQDETLHGPNEYVVLRNILEDAKAFAHIALQNVA